MGHDPDRMWQVMKALTRDSRTLMQDNERLRACIHDLERAGKDNEQRNWQLQSANTRLTRLLETLLTDHYGFDPQEVRTLLLERLPPTRAPMPLPLRQRRRPDNSTHLFEERRLMTVPPPPA